MDGAALGMTVAADLMSRDVRRWLLEQIDGHTDPRAARWWALVATVRGDPPEPPDVGRHRHAYGWLIEALRARVGRADRS
jgi:hypothetical protein